MANELRVLASLGTLRNKGCGAGNTPYVRKRKI